MRPGGGHLTPASACPPPPMVPSPPQVQAQLGPPGPLARASPRRQQMALWAQAGLGQGTLRGGQTALPVTAPRPPEPRTRSAGRSVGGTLTPHAQGRAPLPLGVCGPGGAPGAPTSHLCTGRPSGVPPAAARPTAQAPVLPRRPPSPYPCPPSPYPRPGPVSAPPAPPSGAWQWLQHLRPGGHSPPWASRGVAASTACWACSVPALGQWGPAGPARLPLPCPPCTPPAGLPSPVSPPGAFAHGPARPVPLPGPQPWGSPWPLAQSQGLPAGHCTP